MHLDLAGFQGHGFAGAGQGIGPAAVHLDGGIGRRGLPDAAAEGGQGPFHRPPAATSSAGATGHGAFHVVGVGGEAEARLEGVGLGHALQVFQEARAGADAGQEQPGGGRIQGAGMAHPPAPEEALQGMQGLEGAHAARLVEEQEARRAREGPQASSDSGSALPPSRLMSLRIWLMRNP